jgi:hypothetical protein
MVFWAAVLCSTGRDDPENHDFTEQTGKLTVIFILVLSVLEVGMITVSELNNNKRIQNMFS